MIGDGLGSAVAAVVSVGVSVGVAGRGMDGVRTSLAWLAGPGEAYAEGLLVGLLGAGAEAEGQRLQVAAQYPPAGALVPNMKAELQCPIEACNTTTWWQMHFKHKHL